MLASQQVLAPRFHTPAPSTPVPRPSTQQQRSRRRCISAAASGDGPSGPSRRALLAAGLGAPLLQLAPFTSPQWTGPAQAAGFTDALSRAFPAPPQPVLFPRKALDQRFAVLLLRSGYEAADALDYIPMDSFQVKFWKLRQSEQEGYNVQYLPLRVRQGDITDPLYLDFISSIQFRVAGDEMAKGAQVFKEFCEECESQSRIVRRDPALSDNGLLPAAFLAKVGDFIYTGLRDGFRGEVFGAPQALPKGAPLPEVVANVQRILDIMVDRGYALKAEVSLEQEAGSPAARLRAKVQGPTNLWSIANLSFRRAPVVNTYDGLAVSAYLRACGLTVSDYQYGYTDTALEEEWVVLG